MNLQRNLTSAFALLFVLGLAACDGIQAADELNQTGFIGDDLVPILRRE